MLQKEMHGVNLNVYVRSNSFFLKNSGAPSCAATPCCGEAPDAQSKKNKADHNKMNKKSGARSGAATPRCSVAPDAQFK
jgi:hypothetical protein